MNFYLVHFAFKTVRIKFLLFSPSVFGDFCYSSSKGDKVKIKKFSNVTQAIFQHLPYKLIYTSS